MSAPTPTSPTPPAQPGGAPASPTPAPPGAPGSEQPQDLPIAADHVSYSAAYEAGDDGQPGTSEVLNHVIESARSLNVAPDALHGVVRAVVEARPRDWDSLIDVAAEAAGRAGIGFDAFEQMLAGLQQHLAGRDAYDEMRSDATFRADLQGLNGPRAQRLASQRVNAAARGAFGKG